MRNSGFTIVELMIVVVIIAILGAVSGPPIMHWIEDSKLQSAQVNLRSDLQMAKTQAIKEKIPIGVRFETDKYIIFFDDGTGSGAIRGDGRKQDPNDKINEAPLISRTLKKGITLSHNTGSYFGFDERGTTTRGSFGTVTLTNGLVDKDINISITGHISTY